MARPIKAGLDYFSHDTTPGRKMRYIEVVHRGIGKALFYEILEILYREQGYYLSFPDRELVLMASKLDFDLGRCREALQSLLEEGLFHHDLYKKYTILTSRECQKRYLEGCGKRVRISIIEPYWLYFPDQDEPQFTTYQKIVFAPLPGDNPGFRLPKLGIGIPDDPETTLEALVSTQIRLNKIKVDIILSRARELENQFDEHNFLTAVLPLFAATQQNKSYTPFDRSYLFGLWKDHGTVVMLEQVYHYGLSKLKRLSLIGDALDPANNFVWDYRGEPSTLSGKSREQRDIRSAMTKPDYYTTSEGL
jgi:hypothetical protein